MLTLHLLGATLSLVLVLAGGIGLWKQSPYKWLIVAIPIVGLWQIATGIGLAFEGANLLRLCGSGLAYLSIMAILEYELVRLRSTVRTRQLQ